MLNIKFNLKEPSKDTSLIVMVAYVGKKLPFKYSLSEKIPTQFWNPNTQRVREVREYQHARAINKKIERHYLALQEIFTADPTADLKLELDRRFGKVSDDTSTFFKYFAAFLKERAKQSNVRSYRSTLAALKAVAKDTTIENVDYSYLKEFIDNFSKKKIKKGKSKGQLPKKNYISTQIKNIKAVLNDARKNKHKISATIEDIKKESEEVDSVYLTAQEIEAIEKLQLKDGFDKARDLFLIGCYTALRFSDYSKISSIDIKRGFIYKTAKKTKNRTVIPIHYKALRIFEKYNNSVPKLSDVKLNLYIKEICRMAGINEVITITETQGGITVTRECKKYELVSTHTARRTGATNMYLAGIAITAIRLITGHKSEREFLNYIKVTKEQNAELLAKHPYFTGASYPDQS